MTCYTVIESYSGDIGVNTFNSEESALKYFNSLVDEYEKDFIDLEVFKNSARSDFHEIYIDIIKNELLD